MVSKRVGKLHVAEFDSIHEFIQYIETTDKNWYFRNREAHSTRLGAAIQNWTGTKSYEQALDYMKNGWSFMAEKLQKEIPNVKDDKDVVKEYKNIIQQCGYQAIVPLYLNGIPNNMINKQLKPVKQKVITITKTFAVSCDVSQDMIVKESIKCFQIIKKIEASGIRVNLNVILGSANTICKIRLKSAGERLNISKLAFPLVNPSMYRRLFLRFLEVHPDIDFKASMLSAYGIPASLVDFKMVCDKSEIVLPTILMSIGDSKQIEKYSTEQLISMCSK